jgi:Carboxypeptidase regulatory-like domain
MRTAVESSVGVSAWGNTRMTLSLRRVAFAVVTLALTMPGAASSPQIGAINGAPPGSRTGLIVGQVVDATTGAPIPEAVVQLTMPKYLPDLPTTPRDRVMADGEGRYFFADLPAGDYFLRASKDGYTGGTYGQRRASGETRLFSLGEGERRTDATLMLWKYAVIGGTVVDEAGEPSVGVTVYALSRDFLGGRARFGKMTTQPWAVPTTTTDDRGMFRISQLTPGSYVVVVPSTQTTVPVAVLGAYGQTPTLRNALLDAVTPNGSNDWKAELENTGVGQSRTQQVGDFALLTMNRVLIPPPATAAGRMQVYQTTYYPAASAAGSATVITLRSGEERSDANVTLRPVPSVRLSGRLVTPDGAPPLPTSIRLVGESAMDVGDAGFETVTGMSDASGRFTLLGVPPGDYALKNASTRLALTAMQGLPAFWVQQRVMVGTRDIENLTVELRPALRVEGRLEFRGASGRPPAQGEIGPRLVQFEPPFGEQNTFAAEYLDRATFSTLAAAGQYIVRPHEVSGWFVQSVTLDGKDITDSVVDFQADTTSLVVVYTDRPSKVSGTVKDAHGDASANAVVLAFPADPERWSGYGTNPRTVKSAPASRSGAYTFANVPAGEYFLIAIDGAEADGWTDPKTLEVLARQATRLSVVAAESRTLDLTLRVIR